MKIVPFPLLLPMWVLMGAYGCASLHSAAAQNNAALVNRLLSEGDDLERQEYDGTPLCYASLNRRPSMVKLLIERGAKVNNGNSSGYRSRSPLHAAAFSGCIECAKILLSHGADPNVLNREDMTPLQTARNENRQAFAEWMVNRLEPAKTRQPSTFVSSTGASQAAPASPVEVRVQALLDPEELASANIGRVAVPQAVGSGVDRHVIDILTDTAVAEASLVQGVSIIGNTDIEAMLSFEQQKDLLACEETTCMAELGGALGVDAILSVRVGKLGSTYRLSGTLIDILGARPLVRGDGKLHGSPDALIDICERLVREMLTALRTQ